MALESVPLVWVTEGNEVKPELPPIPEGYYCARSYTENWEDIVYPAIMGQTVFSPPTADNPEWHMVPAPVIRPEIRIPDPRPKLAFYEYLPIPEPVTPDPPTHPTEAPANANTSV